MKVTPDTVVVGVAPRISRETFCRVLREAGSPAAGECEAGYDAVASQGVDPAFALAVFRHESNYGKAGICAKYDTKNPGNTRTSRTGVGEVIQTERGRFVRYPSWVEGFRDLAFRLVDPTYVYAAHGLRTIRDIIPVWAPVTDANDPQRYIEAVVAAMNEWIEEEAAMARSNQIPATLEGVPGVPFRVALIPKGNRNRPGYPMTPAWVTVHETANTRPGANAEMHRQFVWNGGGREGVSFHFVVDDREVIQLLPLTENAWHAGDGPNGPGNRTSVAIETCVNSDADWNRTLQNLVALVAELCRVLRLGTDRVVQHNRWSGKDCPARIRREGRWDWLLAQVGERLAQAQAGSGEVVQLGPFGRHVGHGCLAFWRQLEQVDATLPLRVLGWPLTEEFELDGAVYQVFERSVLKWDREQPAPWDIHVALFEDAVRARVTARKQGLMP